ncbi:hypothetical protein [Methanobacterium aggregans]|nr:hypothetical protein [Methanobacterium aggregans]MBP2045227.1 hypothetical protein [Methanobacterium aggregans]
MGTLAVILMIVLFLVLMVFIFSIALLTPLIGKKNLLFVIFLGFTVGVVGGAFFISPIMDDIPDMGRSIYQFTSNSSEVIEVDVATNTNVTQFIETTKGIEGVKSVKSNEITIKTDPFSDTWKNIIMARAASVNSNITSISIPSNNTIIVKVNENSNPQNVINNLEEWLMFAGGINIKYSTVHVSVNVDSSQVDTVVAKLPQDQIVITGIKGPVEDKIQYLNAVLPKKSNVVLVCGILGMLVGLTGVFLDTILEVLRRTRDKFRKKEE